MGRNNPRAKRPTGETTHLIRANRPTPKTRAKRPRANRPGETTHGRNDPDSSQPAGSELCDRDAKPFLTVLTAVHTSFIRGAWAPSATLREYSSTEGGNH